MKKILWLLCLINSIHNVHAQLHVQVKDAVTLQPLSFATAECIQKGWGTYSDSSGKINIPDSIWKISAVTFSYVGYIADSTRLTNATTEVRMIKIAKRLDDVTIKPCKEFVDEKLEVRRRKKNFFFGFGGIGNGFMWATYLPNQIQKKGLIKSFSYGVRSFYKETNLNTPIRLRFYEFDTASGLPGEEITTEPIMLIPGKTGWITTDITQYHIIVPADGVVAAFEMFDAGTQYHFKSFVISLNKEKKEEEHYGWSILGLREDGLLCFAKTPGRLWRSFHDESGASAAPQAAIRISVCK